MPVSAGEQVRIGMVVWRFHPLYEGGAEKQCRRVSEELSDMGHPCTVITARLKRSLPESQQLKLNLEITRLGRLSCLEETGQRIVNKLTSKIASKWKESTHFWLLLPLVWTSRLSFLFALRTYIRKHQDHIDVLHVHEAHWIAAATAWAASGTEIPVLCKEATYSHTNRLSYDTPLRRTLARYQDRLEYIAMTDEIRYTLEQRGVAPDRITIIPNGISVPEGRAEIGGSNRVIYLGNFSQGNEIKAFDVLFKAWTIVQSRSRVPALLQVLGAGDSTEWQRYLEDNNCLESVEFVGFVSNVGQYLSAARAFVLPSRVEGLSNALLEAMSWGLPVVISDIAAHRSIIQNEQNGLVVPVNSSEALAEGMLRLLEDNSLSYRLGSRARQTIEDTYQITSVVKQLLRLYRSVQEQQAAGDKSAASSHQG